MHALNNFGQVEIEDIAQKIYLEEEVMQGWQSLVARIYEDLDFCRKIPPSKRLLDILFAKKGPVLYK